MFDLVQSDLLCQWKRDRDRRWSIPLFQMWRGCLGLAALLQGPGHNHGRRLLYSNRDVTWLCLRDIPAGHFPASWSMNRREVHYANRTTACLRHGMPALDFTREVREAWDFRFMPFDQARKHGEWISATGDILNSGQWPREYAVLNRLSWAMTDYAFFAVNDRDQPIRKAWERHRPEDGHVFRPTSPMRWMPRSYLGFRPAQVEQLYWLATQTQVESFTLRCPCCRRRIELSEFRQPACKLVVYEDGDFSADCLGCRCRRKWHLADAEPGSMRRRFNAAFQKGFCRAVEQGLALEAPGPMQYMGAYEEREAGWGPDLVPHRLLYAGGQEHWVFLPRQATVLCTVGAALNAGEEWCRVLPEEAPHWWRRQTLEEQWATLPRVCGDKAMVEALQQVWFEMQGLRPEGWPGLVFYPAELVASAVRDLESAELIWNCSVCERYFEAGLDALIFPPMRLGGWDKLRLALPGDVELNASIADPRFSASGVLPRVHRTTTHAAVSVAA